MQCSLLVDRIGGGKNQLARKSLRKCFANYLHFKGQLAFSENKVLFAHNNSGVVRVVAGVAKATPIFQTLSAKCLQTLKPTSP